MVKPQGLGVVADELYPEVTEEFEPEVAPGWTRSRIAADPLLSKFPLDLAVEVASERNEEDGSAWYEPKDFEGAGEIARAYIDR